MTIALIYYFLFVLAGLTTALLLFSFVSFIWRWIWGALFNSIR